MITLIAAGAIVGLTLAVRHAAERIAYTPAIARTALGRASPVDS